MKNKSMTHVNIMFQLATYEDEEMEEDDEEEDEVEEDDDRTMASE